MLSPEVQSSEPRVEKSDGEMKFRMTVQVEVMKELGLFDLPEYKKAKTKEEKTAIENNIFLGWVSSGNNDIFRECYFDIVPPGSDVNEKDPKIIASEVIAEMKPRLSQ